MQFEVQVPEQKNSNSPQTFVVEAPNWLLALRDGLIQAGNKNPQLRNISCTIADEHNIRVVVSQTGQIYEIRPVQDSQAETLAQTTKKNPLNINASLSGGQTLAFDASADIMKLAEKIVSGEVGPEATKAEDLPSEEQVVEPVQGQTADALEPVPDAVLAEISPTAHAPTHDGMPGAEQSVNAAPPVNTHVNLSSPESQETSSLESQDTASPEVAEASENGSEPPLLEQAPQSQASSPQVDVTSRSSTVSDDVPVFSEPLPELDPPDVEASATATTEAAKEMTAVSLSDLASSTSSQEASSPVIEESPVILPEPNAPIHARPAQETDAYESRYKPGMTTEILADAFMRAMEIYDYGNDRHAAMEFILEIIRENVPSSGGAILLTDINSPNQELWFEAAYGPKSGELLNFRLPMGQGIVGYCAKQGISQIVADAQQDPRCKNEILQTIGIQIGPMLCSSIQHQKRVLGAIQLYKVPGQRPFTQGEQSIINYLAHTAGEYLINLV
ncbi:MAG: GAF domain-containing protein [Myxococcota bacterium]